MDSLCHPRIFNVDETRMPLDPKKPRCVHRVGDRNPLSISLEDKTQITVVACVSAVGYCIPPMVIWDHKMLSAEMAKGEVPGTIYGLFPKGWVDQELFSV